MEINGDNICADTIYMKKLISLILLIALCMTPLCVFAEGQPAPKKLVAITFDDGPGKYTEELLDGLKERGAKATFFMLGKSVRAYKDTVRRAYNEGHQIANHTYDHDDLSKLSAARVKSEVESTVNVLREVIGDDSLNFCVRPPYGAYNSTTLANLNAPAIYWSVDSNDWRWTNDVDKTVAEIEKNVFDGAVILLHDTHAWSVKAALKAIDDLQKDNYEFVTVSELFRRRGVSMENGKVYKSRIPTGTQLPAVSVLFDTVETESGKYITMSAVPGGSIRYEIGNAAVTRNSPVYTGPISYKENMDVYAMACLDNNGSRSDICRLYINEKGNCFADVYPGDWYYESMDYFLSSGISKGTGNNLMEPFSPLSRAMIVTFLYRFSGEPAIAKPNSFTDVADGEWYTDAIAWAASEGIVNGYPDGSFKPDNNVSREDLASIIYRSDRTADGPTLKEGNVLFNYSDYGTIYDYAKDAVRWALANDFLVTEGNVIAPHENASRAAAIEMIYRHYKAPHTIL